MAITISSLSTLYAIATDVSTDKMEHPMTDAQTQDRREPPVRLLGINEVKAMTGLSESSIVRGMADGWFPAGRRVGPRAIRWEQGRLVAWIESLPEVGRSQAA